jgi:DNA-binding transcriptional MerR regulator
MKKLTDRQLRYAPREVRLRQIEKAESLLEELAPEDNYHYRDICERITSFRPDMESDVVISGEEVVHDLRCFVEDLSDSADIPIESVTEEVFTVKDLSDRYNVSTKTVDRWRDRGLVSRRFKIGNRKRVGFLKSSVDRFVERHSDEIHRGSKFSQLTEVEREAIIRRARRMARYGGCPAEISRRLARKLGRSVEAIRYTLKNYDQEHPESAVFPLASVPMTDELRGEIFRSFRRGVPVDVLANRYCRTKSSVYRIVSEVRAQRLLEQPIDFMDSEEFHAEGADGQILTTPPESKPVSTVRVPPGLPPSAFWAPTRKPARILWRMSAASGPTLRTT